MLFVAVTVKVYLTPASSLGTLTLVATALIEETVCGSLTVEPSSKVYNTETLFSKNPPV